MTRLPFLDRAFLRPTPREIDDRSKRNGSGVAGASGKRNSQVGAAPKQYRLDNLAEYLLSPQGRETLGLIALAVGSLGLIYLLQHG